MKESKTVELQRKILSDNINRYLNRKGISQTDMARDLGIPETTVSSWLNNKKYPRIGSIQAMADYFKVKRSDLTEEKSSNLIEISQRTVKVPVLGEIACGDPILAEENYEDYRDELADSLPAGDLVYLKAKGDSMSPTIPNGSFVLVRAQNDVENGEIAAVLVNGNTEATLKRVKKQGDVIILMPDNSSHEPYIIDKNNPAKIIGKAIRFTQDL